MLVSARNVDRQDDPVNLSRFRYEGSNPSAATPPNSPSDVIETPLGLLRFSLAVPTLGGRPQRRAGTLT
jgi:hypothetical protein